MLNFFDKLKSIFDKPSLKISDSFKIFNKTEVHNTIIVNDKKELEGINLAALSSDKEKKLIPLFKESPKGTRFMSDSATKLLNEAAISLKDPGNQSLLDFFINKIPSDDFRILKSALVIRDKFSKGDRDIPLYKRQLADTYGNKAYVICNLVTAHYFEDFLRPLYETMSRQINFEIDDFRKAYVKLIEDFPIAIFVNINMNPKTVEAEIRQKIANNKKYEIPYLNIHGIGEANMKCIGEVISTLKLKEDYTQKSIDNKNNIIIVRLRFD